LMYKCQHFWYPKLVPPSQPFGDAVGYNFLCGLVASEQNFRKSYQRFVGCKLALWILRVLWQERWYIETCL
jgi:hypothetical protein